MSFPFLQIGLLIKVDPMILPSVQICLVYFFSIVSSIAHMMVLDTLLAVFLACAIFTIFSTSSWQSNDAQSHNHSLMR